MAALRFDDAMRETERAVEVGAAPALWKPPVGPRTTAATMAQRGRSPTRVCAAADDAAVRVSCLALGGRVRHGAGDLAAASLQLERAVAEEAPPEVRGLSSVWLALARLHQGRADEAVVLLQRAMVDQDASAHPFAGLHARFGRVLAFGYLDECPRRWPPSTTWITSWSGLALPATALRGPAINGHAWILRWCGAGGEADDLNTSAIELTEPTGPQRRRTTQACSTWPTAECSPATSTAPLRCSTGWRRSSSGMERWRGTNAIVGCCSGRVSRVPTAAPQRPPAWPRSWCRRRRQRRPPIRVAGHRDGRCAGGGPALDRAHSTGW